MQNDGDFMDVILLKLEVMNGKEVLFIQHRLARSVDYILSKDRDIREC
jgi:hypothetical protein